VDRVEAQSGFVGEQEPISISAWTAEAECSVPAMVADMNPSSRTRMRDASRMAAISSPEFKDAIVAWLVGG
jgi:hypothetical protein